MDLKLIADINKMGCKTPKEAALTLQAFKYLLEVKKYWNVSYNYSQQLECIYLTAKVSKSSPLSYFVPVSASESFTMNDLRKYLTIDKLINSVKLIIIHPDSSCVVYRISDGLLTPNEDHKVSREEKRTIVDKEILKQKLFLEEAALLGVPTKQLLNSNNTDPT